jgi:hypothetical protein
MLREMKHNFGLDRMQRVADAVGVGDVHEVRDDVGADTFDAPHRVSGTIEQMNLVSALEQSARQIAADEAGSSGERDACHCSRKSS